MQELNAWDLQVTRI